MNQMSIEDMSLLLRALYRDVTDLDERLRRLQASVLELRASGRIDPDVNLRGFDLPTRT